MPVGVLVSLATPPMSPATMRVTVTWSRPRTWNNECKRSSDDVWVLTSRASLSSVPESTLNSDTCPRNGSATVLNT